MAVDHNSFANLIWQIADLLRGPYRPPQYKRSKGGKLAGDALDTKLSAT
jgi:hypothetical protein